MKKAVWSYFLQYIQNITYIFIHTPEYTQQGLEGYAAKAKSGYLLVGRVLSMFDLYVDFCSRQKTTLSCSHQSLYITYFNSLHRFSTALYFYLWFACLLSTLPKFISLIHSCREGNGTPLQYSCLENPMDGGAWWAAVHGVTKSQTRLSDLTFTFHFHALEKEMATPSSVLAWRIPGTGSLVGCCLCGRTESDTTEAT